MSSFAYPISVSLCSGLLYAYYYWFLKDSIAHQFNRFYLIGAVVLSMTIPLVRIPIFLSALSGGADEGSLFSRSIAALPEVTEGNLFESIGAGQSAGTDFNIQEVITMAYLALTSYFLLVFVISLIRIMLIIRKHPIQKPGGFIYVLTDRNDCPFSFFKWIFWNRSIPQDDLAGRQMMRHEEFHVRQQHSLDRIFMEIITAVCWFNPIFWLIRKDLCNIHEFMADKAVIAREGGEGYSELLLGKLFGTSPLPLTIPFFKSSHIKRRILMLYNSGITPTTKIGKWMSLPFLILTFAVFALSFRPVKPLSGAVPVAKPITIVIDAGHGGHDKGAFGLDGSASEADITMQISKKIADLATDANVKVILTRKGNSSTSGQDDFVDVRERVNITKKINPAAFISIHINNSPDKNANGCEVYVSRKKEHDENSLALGNSIIKAVSPLGLIDLGVKKREQGIWVLDAAGNYPAVLVSVGYMSNKKDLDFITDPANQEKIAKAIFEAAVSTLSSSN